MPTYSDDLLNSLEQVYNANPGDLGFKKYFASQLHQKGQLLDALKLFTEIAQVDQDLTIQRTIADIKAKLPSQEELVSALDSEEDKNNLLAKISSQPHTNKLDFSHVAGMEKIKDAIRTDIIYPFQHPEIYQKYNQKAGGGILLFGPPGCGKTYIAKATAGEIDAQFISIGIHELLSSYAGDGERMLHEVFDQARAASPSVLFFDEIDAIGSSRSKTAGVLRTLVNQFLIELDGINSNNEGVLIIGATNLPWEVDSALKRPGRFDKVLFVTPPDKTARAHIFKLNMTNKPHDDIDYQHLAALTRQYSAADITRICDQASETAFKQAIVSGKEVPITQELLEASAVTIRSSILDWFETVRNYITYSNESGTYNAVKDYLDELKHDR